MLRKLLKYDFKAVMRFWWIAAVASVGLAILGGGCIAVLNADKVSLTYEVLSTLAVLALIITIVGMSAFSLLSMILCAIRYYKNLFTDEGYLTFTLPVKRVHLLNSKLITTLIIQTMAGWLLIVDILLMLIIGFAEEVFTTTFLQEISDFFSTLIREGGVYLWIYLAELSVLSVLSSLFSILLLYACITFASIITRKAKVIAAIGIYYGVSGVVAFTVELLALFGIPGLAEWLLAASIEQTNLIVALALLATVLLMAMFCGLLYLLQYWMLDRKLNLS